MSQEVSRLLTEASACATDEFEKELEACGAILHGHFVLSSGLHSATYVQCAKAMENPVRGEAFCKRLADQIKTHVGEAAFDVVVSPAMGAILVGYEVARALGLPFLFVERVNGTFHLRRGFTLQEGQRVLVVEDVVTTGLSTKESIAVIHSYGSKTTAVASLINRSGGSVDFGVPYFCLLEKDIPVYDANSLPEALQKIPVTKPGSRVAALSL